jgi:para-nitrobenzyl esterase
LFSHRIDLARARSSWQKYQTFRPWFPIPLQREINMRQLIWLIVLAAGTSAFASASDPIVAVTGGRIRGATLEGGAAVFEGIPYAQAPIGELRWREPMPVAHWSGVRDATSFGAPCAQTDVFMANAKAVSREDCLYLNVWSPELPSRSAKPVMVWIPGGGNFAGGSRGGLTDGQTLMRRGIVVVTINYRLGLFGFFSHPALSSESTHHASGNQGILDQIAALRWVRDNISGFGGDPSNITIFGASAGSLDVSALMTSPLSKGLFHRAIAQSGAVSLFGPPRTKVQAEQEGQSFGAQWTGGDGSLARMRSVPTDEILRSQPDYLRAPPPNFGITVDGFVFSRPPADVFALGREHPVALLVGSNLREMLPGFAPPAVLEKVLSESYGPMALHATALYGKTVDPIYGTPQEQWATDTSFRCPAVAQALWHAEAGHIVYEYQFDWDPPGGPGIGAVHGAELEYVFGTLGARMSASSSVDRNVFRELSMTIQGYWTNFARYGDPNGKGLPTWPLFRPPSRQYIEFTDTGPVTRTALRREYCDLFVEGLKHDDDR